MLAQIVPLTLVIVHAFKLFCRPALVTHAVKATYCVHTHMIAAAVVSAAFLVVPARSPVSVELVTVQTRALVASVRVDTRVLTVMCAQLTFINVLT